eukprot:29802-Eustigmatos_ZCMA.PRE.1
MSTLSESLTTLRPGSCMKHLLLIVQPTSFMIMFDMLCECKRLQFVHGEASPGPSRVLAVGQCAAWVLPH